MGKVESTENGCPSLAGLEAILVDPSTILGESQQEISKRNHLAANSPSHIPLSGGHSNPEVIHLLVSSSLEVDSGLHIREAAGLQGESQIREAEPEIWDMLNPLALFPSAFIDHEDELPPNAQTLSSFVPTSRYINFLLIIIYILHKTDLNSSSQR